MKISIIGVQNNIFFSRELKKRKPLQPLSQTFPSMDLNACSERPSPRPKGRSRVAAELAEEERSPSTTKRLFVNPRFYGLERPFLNPPRPKDKGDQSQNQRSDAE